jgi:hypothetical protein
MASGSKQEILDLPLSRFPLRGQAGAGGFPPRRGARHSPANHAGMCRCCRLPPQEGFQNAALKSPLRIPLLACGSKEFLMEILTKTAFSWKPRP